MRYNFDQLIDRRGTDSAKWNYYGDDALPLWVADMDFVSPQPVLEALHRRIDHGVFGYGITPTELQEEICHRLDRLYNWSVTPEQIIFFPGLVTGFNAVCRAVAEPGEGVLVQTPVYPPFLSAPGNHDQILQTANLTLVPAGQTFDYEIDYDLFEAKITPQTRLFLFCNPHNPIGRGYSPAELRRLAEICDRHDLLICSDEIHCDLLLDDSPHTPLATLDPEIARRCITLMSPSKTYNLAGLGCGYAIAPNEALRERLERAAAGIVPYVNVLGYTAALAAYRQGAEWLQQALAYLAANRDFAVDYITKNLPGVRTTVPQATYLLWLDCRESGIEGNPHEFFLEKARVALNDGANFGQPGRGFVRLNLGCPRARLEQGLEQMRQAFQTL